MPGAKHRQAAGELFTAHQIAQSVVLVQIDSDSFTLGFRNAVELPVAGVGISQGDAGQVVLLIVSARSYILFARANITKCASPD